MVHIKFYVYMVNKIPSGTVILKRLMATNDVSVWYGRSKSGILNQRLTSSGGMSEPLAIVWRIVLNILIFNIITYFNVWKI